MVSKNFADHYAKESLLTVPPLHIQPARLHPNGTSVDICPREDEEEGLGFTHTLVSEK